MTKSTQILNLLFFQVSWWSYFVAAYYGNVYAVVLIWALFSVLHFYFVSENKNRDLKIMVGFGVLGYFVDLFVFNGFLFTVQHKTFADTLWLFGMWWGFISCFSYSMKKIILKPALGLPLAAFFGPLSYLAGEKIGVLSYFKPMPLYYSLHGIFWAALFFLLFKIEKRKMI